MPAADAKVVLGYGHLTMIYYPPLTRVLPLTTVRRERLLPIEGEVLVGMGARVDPTDVVARAEVPGRYHILHVAEALDVAPDKAEQFIRVRPGHKVKAGQAIAGRRASLGLVPLLVRAPADGVVVAVGGGRVLFESVGEPIEVHASLPGTIANVMPKFGVLVETVGALIQGVWGNGNEAFGVLKVVVKGHDEPLRARLIDVASHGAIVVGGSTMDQRALEQALELQVRGVIIGSLDPALVEMASSMPFPIIATEGLGKVSMTPSIFQLLSTNQGREAAISGQVQPRWGAIRPEIVIPLPARSAPPPPTPDTPLQPGMEVRVSRGPRLGAVGTVQSLPPQPMPLETKARVWGAMVAFEDQEAFVPLFNLEILG